MRMYDYKGLMQIRPLKEDNAPGRLKRQGEYTPKDWNVSMFLARALMNQTKLDIKQVKACIWRGIDFFF